MIANFTVQPENTMIRMERNKNANHDDLICFIFQFISQFVFVSHRFQDKIVYSYIKICCAFDCRGFEVIANIRA